MNSDDDDLANAADEYLEGTEIDVLCPITGEPVIEGEKAYDFAGAPEAVFWKILAKRDMSASDYVSILKSGTEGVRFEGFTSNEGKAFACRVRYNANRIDKDGERSPGVEFLFEKPKELKVLCPQSGKPVIEREKFYSFPGVPGLFCWKEVAKRKMSAEDYREVIAKGTAHFEGFRSRKTGKKFDANLRLVMVSEREGKGQGKPCIEFNFPDRS